jgi:hypothetical protein
LEVANKVEGRFIQPVFTRKMIKKKYTYPISVNRWEYSLKGRIIEGYEYGGADI